MNSMPPTIKHPYLRMSDKSDTTFLIKSPTVYLENSETEPKPAAYNFAGWVEVRRR